MERLIATNRVIPYPTYVAFFPYYQGRIEHFEQNYPDMPVYCLDNSHNNGGRLVTTDEARQWDYTMDATLQNKLYTIMWTYILSGKMTDDQIYAVQKPERM